MIPTGLPTTTLPYGSPAPPRPSKPPIATAKRPNTATKHYRRKPKPERPRDDRNRKFY